MIELFLELPENIFIKKEVEIEKRGIQTFRESYWEEEIKTINNTEKLNETNTSINFTIKF